MNVQFRKIYRIVADSRFHQVAILENSNFQM